jgi:hypothetical protein
MSFQNPSTPDFLAPRRCPEHIAHASPRISGLRRLMSSSCPRQASGTGCRLVAPEGMYGRRKMTMHLVAAVTPIDRNDTGWAVHLGPVHRAAAGGRPRPLDRGVGDSFDNALARKPVVDHQGRVIYWPATTFATRVEAQAALFRYLDGWYNPRRIQHEGIVPR